MPSVRVQRIRELLKRQLGEIVRRELPPELSVLTSVHEVDLAADLKSATVHVGVIGTPGQQRQIIDRLTQDRVRFQELVAQAVILRYTPRLQFQLDTSIERGNRILSILDELEQSNPPRTS
jgi:ribosome-binding factor A